MPRFAPGAVVTAVLPDGRALVDVVHAGSSYLSSEDPRIHFGLGSATTVTELTVRYPAAGSTVMKVRADRRAARNRLAPGSDLGAAHDRVERDRQQQDRAGDDVDHPFE